MQHVRFVKAGAQASYHDLSDLIVRVHQGLFHELCQVNIKCLSFVLCGVAYILVGLGECVRRHDWYQWRGKTGTEKAEVVEATRCLEDV
jgi:hypothetical protein